MDVNVFYGILIPFLGTSAGAACVFFMKKNLNEQVQRALTGFAAGVMVAASVWSLLLPSIADSEQLGALAFMPAAVGFVLGALFICVIGKVAPMLSRRGSAGMTAFAVTLHNIPEGMAVGVVLAGAMAENAGISMAGAMALSIGIAIQNFPEGAIVSMPLKMSVRSRWKAFAYGVGSGVVEPLAGIVTILLIDLLLPVLPYLLGFAAGAMIYVVVEELIPESQSGHHSNIATVGVAMGFALMMILDVALG